MTSTSQLIDGIIYSSWLFVIAVGLTLIYGVMKILNVAHGSLYALGAYAATAFGGYWFAHGYPPLGSYGMLVVAAIAVGLTAGPLIERGLLRLVYGKEEVVLVLVTYAVFLILEDLTARWGIRSPSRALRSARQHQVGD
jgi:branched-chain amino acid transport system permease protein